MMKFVKGILILVAFYCAGTAASEWLHIPLPGNLVGMLLLTGALVTGVIRHDWVEQASSFLIRHMLLFFVPIIAGAASYMHVFASDPVPVLLSLLLGPLLVLLVTGWVVQWHVSHEKVRKQAKPAQERRTLDA